MLLFAVALWSLATMLAPSAATVSTEVFIASRVLVGIGEGLAPAAGLRMVATWVPEAERSRAVATLGAGKTGGSIAGLLLAPVVIGAFGWQAMFYSFGVLGLFWAAVWWVKGQDREGNWAILFGSINLMQSNLFTLLVEFGSLSCFDLF